MSTFIGRKVRITKYKAWPQYIGKIGVITYECNGHEGDDTAAVTVQMEDGQYLSPLLPGSQSAECEWVTEPDISLKIDQLKASGRKIAIHTQSQEQWDKVLEIMEGANVKWCNGDKATDEGNAQWGNNGKNSAIGYQRTLEYSPVEFYRSEGYQIVEASDFIAANTPPVQDIPVPDNKQYVRCISAIPLNWYKVDQEYKYINEESIWYHIRNNSGSDIPVQKENFTKPYNKSINMNTNNTEALSKIADLRKQIDAIEQSLKEPEYVAGMWAVVVKPDFVFNHSGLKDGDIFQIVKMDNDGHPDHKGSKWVNTSTEGSGKGILSTFIRAATKEEIAKANEICIDDYVTIISGSASNCSQKKDGETFKVGHVGKSSSNLSGIWIHEESNDVGNGICRSRVRKATPEEIKQYEASQVKPLTLGSRSIAVKISKGGIEANDRKFPIERLQSMIVVMKNLKPIAEYPVTIPEDVRCIRIGCESQNNLFSINEIQQVIDAYEKLNKCI